jgi:tRNA (mo5U34)-methyltransferase
MTQTPQEIRWFHSIELAPGVHTVSADATAQLRKREQAMLDGIELKGKSVLDIGAWDGYFTFAAKRRGAKRVMALDHFCWSGEGWGSKAGFDFAREKLGMQDVEDIDLEVEQINPESVGSRFDVVLFLGVLYHLRHPLLGLERAASVCTETMVVETAVDARWMRRPAMVFYPGKELNGDPTNWWGPNVPCMVAMLKDLGFSKVSWDHCPGFKKGRAYFVARR